MDYKALFGNEKPVIGMIHTSGNSQFSILETAKREIEIYLKYGIRPLIENYFGSADDCETVLKWMQSVYPDVVYGLNILGDYPNAFSLASAYGAKFIQIDSVCGHLLPTQDEEYAEQLNYYRKRTDVVLLGGVRFKYQAVRSGRSVQEDLKLGMQRCDAIVCTGNGTGIATPMAKVEEFKRTVGGFPIVVGAGVTLNTAKESFLKGDGAIIGSWFKRGHDAVNEVEEANVEALMKALDRQFVKMDNNSTI